MPDLDIQAILSSGKRPNIEELLKDDLKEYAVWLEALEKQLNDRIFSLESNSIEADRLLAEAKDKSSRLQDELESSQESAERLNRRTQRMRQRIETLARRLRSSPIQTQKNIVGAAFHNFDGRPIPWLR